jgi:hypothetical protein
MAAICRVFRPPSSDACGMPARYTVSFGDGDSTKACADCAAYLKQIAVSHGTNVSVSRIEDPK